MSLLLDFAKKHLTPEVKHLDFKAGDTVTVHYKIKEGEKERTQLYTGVVIQRKNERATASFTVRKMSNGIGVERIFPVASPFIEKIEIGKVGMVRRAKLFYLRDRTGKAARIREKLSGNDTPSTK
jgi:large subunit ribosomal protein L19